ncbi:MAG: hypothetical protein V4551_13635, partial [Pseudomonadota bacterium]
MSAVELAIDHVTSNGLDDLAKPPMFVASIEHAVIQANPSEFRDEARKRASKFLRTANLSNVKIGNPRYYMIPKDEHTLRRVAWIDPFDLVKFLSLSLLMFPSIEAARPLKEKSVIHSHRQWLCCTNPVRDSSCESSVI